MITLACLQSPLHLAVRQNSPGLVSELLDQGAAPAVPTVHGDTACHLAVSCGAAECLALLLRHAKPEDVNIFNDSGEEETAHSCKAVAGVSRDDHCSTVQARPACTRPPPPASWTRSRCCWRPGPTLTCSAPSQAKQVRTMNYSAADDPSVSQSRRVRDYEPLDGPSFQALILTVRPQLCTWLWRAGTRPWPRR